MMKGKAKPKAITMKTNVKLDLLMKSIKGQEQPCKDNWKQIFGLVPSLPSEIKNKLSGCKKMGREKNER